MPDDQGKPTPAELRAALFVQPETLEDLHRWIKVYLGIDLPIIRVDPDSNSSPMELVWELYEAARLNKPGYSQVMAYAARDSFKTFSAAIFEVLCLILLERSVAHMAAIEPQAKKSQQYFKKHVSRPFIRDYITSKNERTVEITRYFNEESGENLTKGEFEALLADAQLQYREIKNYVQIIICTIQGANCIDPETMIDTVSGKKAAALVTPGDRLVSMDLATGEYTETEVDFAAFTLKNAMRVSLEGGGSVVLSEDHAVFTRAGWVRARALRLGDSCLSVGASPREDESDAVVLDLPCSSNSSALLGTLLGDSSLTWPRNKKKAKYGKAPRFAVNHCKKQEHYLKRKATVLSAMGIPHSIVPDRRNQIKLFSKTSLKLIPFYDLLYKTGRKAITSEVLELVDLEALAFWFMDDGSGSPELVGSRKDKHLSLATCSFTLEENQLIVDWLKDTWKLDAYVDKVSNGVNQYPIVSLTLDSSRRLSAMLDPYISPGLKYKFPVPSAWMDTKCIVCGDTVSKTNRHGFSGCTKHPRGSLSRTQRVSLKKFESRFGGKISKLEFLGPRYLIDLHLKTEEQKRNFIANSAFLLHNSEHVPVMVVDEVDVVENPDAYEEAKMIPAPINGLMPITLYTSTRKYSWGLVQKELDRAADTGLLVRHWNLIDVTHNCPATRHQPELPKVPIAYSDDTLKAITYDDYKLLDTTEKERYNVAEGYAGCIANCRLFAVCKGRLADIPKCTKCEGNNGVGCRGFPKPVEHTQNTFRKVSLDKAKAQLLCRKPSSEGLIFPNFDREVHMKDPDQMYELVFGEKPKVALDKAAAIEMFKERGARFVAGIDHGFTHNFVVVVGAILGHRLFILDVISQAELELPQKIELCKERVKPIDPEVWADTENPGDNKTLKKEANLRIKEWNKGKGSVVDGISLIRWLLMPSMGRPDEARIFFLKADEGCELLATRVTNYHWTSDAAGRLTNIPDDEDDDEVDAFRYIVLNTFSPKTKVTIGEANLIATQPSPGAFNGQKQYMPETWLRQIISERTGIVYEEEEGDPSDKAGRAGGFSWSF